MGVFDTIAGAKVFQQSNNWFRDGEYEVELVKAEIEKSAKVGVKKVFAKTYFKILDCRQVPGVPGDPPYRAGDEVKAFWDVNNEFTGQNAKAFARAAVEQAFKDKGIDPTPALRDFDDEEKVKGHLEDVFLKGAANGVKLKVSCFTKPGKQYTTTAFRPST
jgi:hypothetical protein